MNMQVSSTQLNQIATEGRAHLIFVPHFVGSDAWLLIETLPGMDREYAKKGDGFLLTAEGERSYWRTMADALEALDRLGLVTEAGSTRVRPVAPEAAFFYRMAKWMNSAGLVQWLNAEALNLAMGEAGVMYSPEVQSKEDCGPAPGLARDLVSAASAFMWMWGQLNLGGKL